MGHWLSIRGALQGLRGIMWAGQPCEPLTKLREAALLHGEARDRRVHEIAEQLRLRHLSTFFERVAAVRLAANSTSDVLRPIPR